MKKAFSILMVAFALTAMVGCTEKEDNAGNSSNGSNGGNNGGGGTPTTLDGTTWLYQTGTNGQQGFVYAGVSFDYGMASVNITTNTSGENDYKIYAGSYTYSGGNGTIVLRNVQTQEEQGTATFSISGSTMTLTVQGQTYTLQKQENGGGNNGGDNGGNSHPTAAELLGAWTYTGSNIAYRFTVAEEGSCSFITSSPSGTETIWGEYTYNERSGTGYVEMRETGSQETFPGSFSVTGTTMTLVLGNTYTLQKESF